MHERPRMTFEDQMALIGILSVMGPGLALASARAPVMWLLQHGWILQASNPSCLVRFGEIGLDLGRLLLAAGGLVGFVSLVSVWARSWWLRRQAVREMTA